MEKEADIKKTREKNEGSKTQKPHEEEWNKDGDTGGAETGNSFRNIKEKKPFLSVCVIRSFCEII